jgi:hypothetical protein
MQGRRIESPFGVDGQLTDAWPLPGDYWFRENWFAVTPDDRLCDLKKHTVVEHEDRTITVSPSILVHGGGQPGSWHGYLERGVWRSC